MLIADDEMIERTVLHQSLYENLKDRCEIFQAANGREALEIYEREKIQIAILDIEMPGINGMEAAKKIREKDKNCSIIFLTAFDEFSYARTAITVRALDYLLKPYTYAQLEDALNRYENDAAKFTHYIELKEGRFQTRILITDIMYVDYHNHYTQVHTTPRLIRSYMSFGDFSPMLSSYRQFLWCYRNCMVNMDYVDSWEANDFILKNGERLPIFRSQRNKIIQTYANYIFDYVNGGTRL